MITQMWSGLLCEGKNLDLFQKVLRDRYWCKMEALKAGIVGFTNFPGNSRESLNIPGKFPFPGKPKIRENRHHYMCVF